MYVSKEYFHKGQKRMEIVDFFLADDIIQGEEVPFYLIWKGDNPKSIEILYEGFKELIEWYNSVESKISVGDGKVVFGDFRKYQ